MVRRRRKLHTGLLAAALALVVTSATVWLFGHPDDVAQRASTGPPATTVPATPARATNGPATLPTPSEQLTASAMAATPGRITVVGLGDSVTSGAACGCTPFVQLYAAGLPAQDGGPATAVNLGQNGQTSTGLLQQLNGNDHTSDEVHTAGTVLLTIGANDLIPQLKSWQDGGCAAACYTPAVDADGDRIVKIINQVRRLRGGAHTLILVTGYWNVFPDGAAGAQHGGPAYLAWSNAVTRALNTRIEAASDTTQVIYVDIYAPFKGNGSHDPTSRLAPDGDHPNAAGHRAIAAMLLAATPAGRPG